MRAFEPSAYSGPASDSGDYGWAQVVGVAIGVAGQLAATGISVSAGKKAQASQQKHEKGLAKAQEELIRLQTEQVEAQVAATRAAGVLEEGGSKKTLLLVAAVLVGVSMIAGAIVINRRPPTYEEDYEE